MRRRVDHLVIFLLLLSTLKGASGKVKIDEIDVKPDGEKTVYFRQEEETKTQGEMSVPVKAGKVGPDLRVEIGYRKDKDANTNTNGNENSEKVEARTRTRDEEYETESDSSKTKISSGMSLKAVADDVAETILAEADKLYGTLSPEPDSSRKERDRKGPRRRGRRKRPKGSGKSSRKKIFIILLIVFLLLLVGGGLGWYFWKRRTTAPETEADADRSSSSRRPDWGNRQSQNQNHYDHNNDTGRAEEGEGGRKFWSKWRK